MEHQVEYFRLSIFAWQMDSSFVAICPPGSGAVQFSLVSTDMSPRTNHANTLAPKTSGAKEFHHPDTASVLAGTGEYQKGAKPVLH